MLVGSNHSPYNGEIALIIGAGGQTALTLLKLLAENGYQVYGNARNSGVSDSHLQSYAGIDFSDFSDPSKCWSLLDQLNPSKIFHFAAVHAGRNQMDQVLLKSSAEMKKAHVDIAENVLSWQRFNLQSSSHIALSSQIFSAHSQVTLINEYSKPSPQNFYGETKLMAWNLLRDYRENFGVRTNGYILFNHGSIFTKEGFFVRDVAIKIAKLISQGTPLDPITDKLLDISTSYDICRALMLITQRDILGDFVLGSGSLLAISSIVGEVFENLKIDPSKLPNFQNNQSWSLLSDVRKVTGTIEWKPENSISKVITELIQLLISQDSCRTSKTL
jgi:GDPmannose 4,6-dehydratase